MKNAIGTARHSMWFLGPEVIPKFLITFGVFVLGSMVYITSYSDLPLYQGLSFVLLTGITMSAALIPLPGYITRHFGNELHDEYDEVNPNNPSDNKPFKKQEEDEFHRQQWIDLLKRGAMKTRRNFINTLFKVAVVTSLFSIMMNLMFGLSPRETLYLSLPVLIGLWVVNVFVFHRLFVYILLGAAMGVRLGIQSFGPQIVQYLPQLLFLPLFYFLMMFFMFGSILYPTIRQFQFIKPGEADLAVRISEVRGQKAAIAKVTTQINRLKAFAAGNTLQKPQSMVFVGKPGVGKTLLAKALATETGLPFVLADGHAFTSGIMGFAPLIVGYIRKRTQTLAREYGGAFVFIDEAENVFQVREGMQPGSRNISVWDIFDYDCEGKTSTCGIIYDVAEARERTWDKKYSKETDTRHGIFLPMGGGGMGGGAIFPLMTWIDGVTPPPATRRIKIRKFNQLMDLIAPVVMGHKILRMKPAKPINDNIVFIAATNRPHMMDPAIRRAGRLGVEVSFELPDLESRKDIALFYMEKEIAKGLMNPNVLDRVDDFAAMTANTSPADMQLYIEGAHEFRIEHVNNLLRIQAAIEEQGLESLREHDQKYWKRWKQSVGKEGWSDLRADWYSLKESKSSVSYGSADPGKTSEEHRVRTAYHEFMGHFIQLKAFLGKHMKPTVLTIMPRREALGMVAHTPLEERDPRPQSFYEGMLRVSIGSTVAERVYFGENQPGVSSDLENATRIACVMVGKFAMNPYACSKKDEKQYASIGEGVISIPSGDGMLGMMSVASLEDKVLMGKSREKVAILLGQAFVDSYRLIKANQDLAQKTVERLLEIDEFSGEELDALWEELDETLVVFENMPEEFRIMMPDDVIELKNPFYTRSTAATEKEVSQ